jgi:hypothetical protein
MYARDKAVTAADLQQRLPADSQVEAATEMLRMLADGTRLRLMWLLVDGEHDVTALVTALGVARPAVSHRHQSRQPQLGEVLRHEGRRALYTARGRHVRRLATEVMHAASHRVAGIPDHE